MNRLMISRLLRLLLTPRAIALIVIIAIGVWVVVTDPVDRAQLIALGEWLTAHPAALLGLVLLQVALFALALPGSVTVWLVAPFLGFTEAVALMVVGSVLGALAAWWVARWLGASARSRVAGHPVYRLLTEASDPFTQTALRVLPGFPHSVVNYAGGVLALPLPAFLGAALVGLTLKWMLYVSAIQALVEAGDDAGGPDAIALLPLLLLASFLIGGSWLARRFRARRLKSSD
ncbi:MAG: VTT domain-containing protein [Gammaproteobacteria bacterium]|nr:VTT domain-containing protein [Gammaproteobacteria bacterium]